MASFRMVHRVTGAVLSGYVVLSATQAEIDQANCNLRRSGSCYRFVEAATLASIAEAHDDAVVHAAKNHTPSLVSLQPTTT